MKAAYVTTLCAGDGYAPGVEALGHSLDRVESRHPKIVLVTPDVPRDARAQLRHQGWALREVQPVEDPSPEPSPLFARFANTFTKLRAWSLVDLDRVVLLDADTIVLANVDELFERRRFAAAPDFLFPHRFNSGVMVLEPCAQTFARMMDALGTASSYDGGDQGFLNSFFSDWYALPIEHRLPAGYNMHQFIYQFIRSHPRLALDLDRDAKIVHYSVHKPWLATSTLAGGSEAWWDVYFDAHPEQASEWKRAVHLMEDWSFDQAVRALVG